MNDFRSRVLNPALIPLGAFVFIGAFVFAFSRILLAVPKDGSVVVGVLMAGCILFAAGALAKGGTMKKVQRTALIAFALVLIGGGVAAGAALGVRPVEKHLQADVTIATASKGTQFAFDKKELDIPAGKEFGLEFDNKDSGTSHNVHILSAPGGTSLFQFPPFPGPAKRVFPVKAIPTGIYFFQCDVHPTVMTGFVRAGNATGGPPPGPGPTGTGTGPPPRPEPTIPLVAKGITFDKSALTFPAGKPVLIDFKNEDAQTTHNFAIYTDATLGKNLFVGDPVTGPGETVYRFTAPGPGTYYFQCNYHPQQMHGTVKVE